MTDLNECFSDYCERKKDFLKNITGDTGKGKAFACFATSVILHDILRKKIDEDISPYFTDDSGDGKIDGIAFVADGNLVHHAGQLRSKPKKCDLYFIQSKKHNTQKFSQKEFREFSEGIKNFILGEGEGLSTSMKQWKFLLEEIKQKRAKITIHLYCATWTEKPQYTFKEKGAQIKQELVGKFNIENVNFRWADGPWLCKKYKAHNKINAIPPVQRSPENTQIPSVNENTTTGKSTKQETNPQSQTDWAEIVKPLVIAAIVIAVICIVIFVIIPAIVEAILAILPVLIVIVVVIVIIWLVQA